jgi:hypothetical protein
LQQNAGTSSEVVSDTLGEKVRKSKDWIAAKKEEIEPAIIP